MDEDRPKLEGANEGYLVVRPLEEHVVHLWDEAEESVFPNVLLEARRAKEEGSRPVECPLCDSETERDELFWSSERDRDGFFTISVFVIMSCEGGRSVIVEFSATGLRPGSFGDLGNFGDEVRDWR